MYLFPRVLVVSLSCLSLSAGLGCGGSTESAPSEKVAVTSQKLSLGDIFRRRNVGGSVFVAMDGDTHFATAGFADLSAATNFCTITKFSIPGSNDCTLQICNPEPDPGVPVSGGTVRVRGTSIPLDLVPASDNSYPFLVGSGSLWSAGEPVAILVEGHFPDVFPTARILSGPHPSIAASLPALVNRAAPLTATWSDPAANVPGSTVTFIVGQPSAGPYDNVNIACRFSPSALSGTIPSSRLQSLVPGADTYVAMQGESFKLVQPPLRGEIGLSLVTAVTNGFANVPTQ